MAATQLSSADVARRLGMSRSTLRRRIAAGVLAATKVGFRYRISPDEFERYARELVHRMAAASAADIDADLARG